MRAKRLLLVTLMIASLLAVGAQEQGGQEGEPAIVVPDIVLEIQEFLVEQVDAALPPVPELELEAADIPLPDSSEIAIVQAAPELPHLEESGSPQGVSASSIYSTGRLGAGTMNHVIGAISLYKLGQDPRFRLEFSHEGRDGFGFEPAGTGFFSAANVIEGWVSVGSETLAVSGEARYDERERGLQGVSQYYSADLRYVEGGAELVYTPEPLVTIAAGVDAAASTRLQSVSGGDTAPRETEYYIAPRALATLEISIVEIGFELGYDIRLLDAAAVPAAQIVDARLGLALTLPSALAIEGDVGAAWSSGSGFEYPWSLGATYSPTPNLELSAGGGFRLVPLRYNDLWKQTPLLSVGSQGSGELANAEEWHAEAGLRWTGVAGVYLDAGAEFAAREASVVLGSYDQAAGLFPFTQARLLRLKPELLFGWQIGRGAQLETGVSADLLDRTVLDPLATGELSLTMGADDNRFGGSVNLMIDLFSGATTFVPMPGLGAEAYFQASEGVELVLRTEDLLSAFLPDGRAAVGTVPTAEYPFIEPGFSLSLLTRISL